MNEESVIQKIEAYLDVLPIEQKTALENLRAVIARAVPEAEEGWVYGVPGFKLNGKSLVCYAAFKHHLGFYPMSPAIVEANSKQLNEFILAKGTIRFQPENPISEELIVSMVQARVAEVT